MLSREYGDIAGAGGVKDVVRQLAEELARWTGRSVNVVIPLYGFLDPEALCLEPVMDPQCPDKPLELDIQMNEPGRKVFERARYYHTRINRVNLYCIDSERFRSKLDVYTYTAAEEQKVWWQKQGTGHHDYFAMNLLLQKGCLELCIGLGQKVDVFHCHDGHSGVLPALIRELPGYSTYFRWTGCLTTVHNAGRGYHQEISDLEYAKTITGLPGEVLHMGLLEEKFDPFLIAGHYGRLSTVSERYAVELQETEDDERTGWLGHELKNRGIELEGITNGIDPEGYRLENQEFAGESEYFDPGGPEMALPGKRRIKQELLAVLGAKSLTVDGVVQHGWLSEGVKGPLFTSVGRLSEQKGIDILIEALCRFHESGGEALSVILGSGSYELEARLVELVEHGELQGRCCFLRGFNPELANRIFAAGDFFIIPSRYEPCGLTDFIAQLFGNIPVVNRVGGLVKVRDGETGLSYRGGAEALTKTLWRAVDLFASPALREMQRNGVHLIEQRYTWKKVMKRYLELYQLARADRAC